MGKIYFKTQNDEKLAKANSETIDFLLNYSKSLQFVTFKSIQFERNLN